MVRLSADIYLNISINDKTMPVSDHDFAGFSVSEDMGFFFLNSTLTYSDTIGLLTRDLVLKPTDIIKIDLIRDNNIIESLKFAPKVPTLDHNTMSQSNVIDFTLISPEYSKVMSKRSRGFTQSSGGAVVSQIMSEIYSLTDIDRTLNRKDWIQPYISNRDMIDMIARKDYAVENKVSDLVYFTKRDGSFNFKSLSNLTRTPRAHNFSNYPNGESIYIPRFDISDPSNIFLSQSGYGTKSYYLNRDTNSIDEVSRSLSSSPLSDTSRTLGFNAPDDISLVLPHSNLNKDIKTAPLVSDYFMMNGLFLSKQYIASTVGYFPDIHIGDVADISLYYEDGRELSAYSGRYLITQNQFYAGPDRVLKSNFRFYRIGMNNNLGRSF